MSKKTKRQKRRQSLQYEKEKKKKAKRSFQGQFEQGKFRGLSAGIPEEYLYEPPSIQGQFGPAMVNLGNQEVLNKTLGYLEQQGVKVRNQVDYTPHIDNLRNKLDEINTKNATKQDMQQRLSEANLSRQQIQDIYQRKYPNMEPNKIKNYLINRDKLKLAEASLKDNHSEILQQQMAQETQVDSTQEAFVQKQAQKLLGVMGPWSTNYTISPAMLPDGYEYHGYDMRNYTPENDDFQFIQRNQGDKINLQATVPMFNDILDEKIPVFDENDPVIAHIPGKFFVKKLFFIFLIFL